MMVVIWTVGWVLLLSVDVTVPDDGSCQKGEADCHGAPGSVVAQSAKKQKSKVVHVSVAVCGDRAPEALMMIKSARMLSRRKLMFHIFAEDNLFKEINQKFASWPAWARKKTEHKLYRIQYPDDGPISADRWKHLFKPCCTQRLFFPNLMPKVDSILYVDSDVLFLRPVEQVWNIHKQFNKTQLAFLVPEHEHEQISWYKRFARIPFYGEMGMNSGVMFMNLTSMRKLNFVKEVTVDIYGYYMYNITWPDQDILNIYFHRHPELLLPMECDWNYRPDHCMYGSNCRAAEQRGVSVLHGSRGYFHTDDQPAFKAVYRAFKEHDLETNDLNDLLKKIKGNLAEHRIKNTGCGEAQGRHSLLTKQLQKQIEKFMKKK